MKKQGIKEAVHIAAVLIFSAGLTALGFGQQPPPDPQRPVSQQPQNGMQTQDAKAFSGIIVKEKGTLVLRDSITKVSYHLDDQERAKQFQGKQVKVVGKLDLDTNLIHIESIALL